MSCESIRAELVAYLQDELSAPRRGEVQRHLDACRECSAELDGFRSAQKAVGSLRVNATSGEFETKVRERIAAKVAELRSRGAVRFRTGRERNAEAARWPGLSVWLSRRRRLVWFFLIAAVPVTAAFVLAWFGIVKPYFDDIDKQSELRRKQMEAVKRSQSVQLRLRAVEGRRDLPVSPEGAISGADFLGDGPLRFVPVTEPPREGRPECRCLYVFTPRQWQAFLDQEAVFRGTRHHAAWKGMVGAAIAARPAGGSLTLPEYCFHQFLSDPPEVSVLAVGEDRFEIWDRSDLDEYLQPRTELVPARP